HANAVVVDGGAVAFCGPSGVGKSTLAAYFARANYPVLCDDVCVVSFDDGGRPHAWPGLRRLKLWSEAANAFGHDPAALDRAFEGADKFQVPLPPDGVSGALPLRSVYLLTNSAGGEGGGISRLRGHLAMAAVIEHTYRDAYLPAMGLVGQNFGQCAALLA